MSGTGVQSAMRRRTRPQEEQRRPTTSNKPPTDLNSNTNQNNNQRIVNPGQILFMHQKKIIEIEKKIGMNDFQTNIENKNNNVDIKKDLEETIDKKLNVVNNNLNFLLNVVNEERSKVKNLEAVIKKLTDENIELRERLNIKVDHQEINNKIKEYLEINKEHTLVSGTEDSIGTLESVETLTNKNVDVNIERDIENGINNMSLDGIDLKNLMKNDENGETGENGENNENGEIDQNDQNDENDENKKMDKFKDEDIITSVETFNGDDKNIDSGENIKVEYANIN